MSIGISTSRDEPKPYSLQDPKRIAEIYGGDLQRIAEAMQLGVVDPTAGTLAGMFIKEMRAGAQPGQGVQQSVAQQIFNPQPQAAPPAPPMGAPAGLGATPQAAEMAQQMPQMSAPPPQAEQMPQPEAPMGMADGGLAGLSVPDTMFDEPNNGGYASGGLVAFAGGSPGTLKPSIDPERLRAALRAQESGGDYGVTNAENSGAMGAYQFMPDTARALAERIGVTYRPELMAGAGGRSKEGRAYQEHLMDAQMEDILKFAGDDIGRAGAYHFAGPNEKGYGPKTRQYQSDILRRYSGSKDTGELPNRDINTPQGQVASTEDIFGRLVDRFGPSAEERALRGKLMARAEEMTSDAYQEKERKLSSADFLTNLGINMMSSKSPFLLQALGEAAAAALPGAIADRKERKALRDRGLQLMVELSGKDRKEAIPLWNMAVEAAKTNMTQQQFIQKQDLDERQVELAERRLDDEIRRANLVKPEDVNDRVTRYMLDFAEGTPQHEAAKRVLAARNPASSSTAGLTEEQIRALREGRGKTGTGGTAEGATAKDNDGKTIVFSNGQWVYP
jgi:hypothetical protein